MLTGNKFNLPNFCSFTAKDQHLDRFFDVRLQQILKNLVVLILKKYS